MKRFIALLLLICVVAACSKSGSNTPSGESSEEQSSEQAPNAQELVASVSALRADSNPNGIILIATGLPDTQGYWGARLIPLDDEFPVDGVLTYEFVVAKPAEPSSAGSPESREIVVGRAISNRKLLGASTIRVVSASNARSLGL